MSFYPYLLYYKALLNFCIYLYVELFEFKQQLFVTLYACSLIDKMYYSENYFMLCSWVRNRNSVTTFLKGFFSPDLLSGWKNRKNELLCTSQKFGENFLQPF